MLLEKGCKLQKVDNYFSDNHSEPIENQVSQSSIPLDNSKGLDGASPQNARHDNNPNQFLQNQRNPYGQRGARGQNPGYQANPFPQNPNITRNNPAIAGNENIYQGANGTNGLPPNSQRLTPNLKDLRNTLPIGAQRDNTNNSNDPSQRQDGDAIEGETRTDLTKRQMRELADSLLGSPSPLPKSNSDPTVIPQQAERRNIFKENPNVYYFNGESLSRPLHLPKEIKRKRWIFVAIAVVIACLMLFFYFDQIISAPAKTQQEIQDVLSQDIKTNPPDLLKILGWSDKKIKSSLTKAASKGGYGIIDITDERVSSNEIDLVKIPAGLTVEEGAEMYARGLSNLSAIDLIKLLYGGWDLNVDRTQNINISLHYADFKSHTPKTAIAQAIASESLSRGTTSESGEDDGFGNEYSSGSIMINGSDYAWTVSSTYLTDVYSVSGIPENATYVGVRLIKKIS